MIAPRKSDQLFDLADLLPTAIALAGVPGAKLADLFPKTTYIDGVDQSGFLVADKGLSARRSRIYTLNQYFAATRIDEFKGVMTMEIENSVVAYNKRTGERIWGALDDRAAYTSPMVVTVAGQRQLIVVTAKRVIGMTVEDGTLLWEFPWTTMYEINCAQPIVTDPNHVFISAAYDHGAALLEGGKRTASLTARTRCRVAVIPGELMDQQEMEDLAATRGE